jgi:hypothetical protein
MSISGLDLNLVHRGGAGRCGLVVIVAPDTICGKGAAANPANALPCRPVQAPADRDSVPMEGGPSRPFGPAEISDYGGVLLAEPAGTRIDLRC